MQDKNFNTAKKWFFDSICKDMSKQKNVCIWEIKSKNKLSPTFQN